MMMTIIKMLMSSSIVRLIAASAISLAVGGYAGWYVKDKFIKAKQVNQLVKVRKDDAKAVSYSQARNQMLTTEIQLDRDRFTTLKKEVRRYVVTRAETSQRCSAETVATNTVGSGQVSVLASDDRLPVGLVRLLNDARTGTPDSATDSSDGEGKAPSDVTAEDFIENDLDVVAEYRELAKKHDELVNFVERLQDEQRKRMGVFLPPNHSQP
jgi:cell division protein FtsB